MLLICVSQHALGAKHLSIILAVKLNFLILMNITGSHGRLFIARASRGNLTDGETREDCIIDWQAFHN